VCWLCGMASQELVGGCGHSARGEGTFMWDRAALKGGHSSGIGESPIPVHR
jgi:hypothetical protein